MLQVFFVIIFCVKIIFMKKTFQRWYEKDEYLKAFMNLLSDLSFDVQCEIAIDIIIRASSMIDRDYTKIISQVGNFNPKNFKRWYDKNPNIHLAIESLRDLDEKQRDVIIREFSDKILNSHYIKLDDIK